MKNIPWLCLLKNDLLLDQLNVSTFIEHPLRMTSIRALILFSIRFHLGIEHLKLQETYTYELLEYLEALDPGRTWTKDQLLQNLQGVIIKKAHGVGK